jgi:hypothetical protein
MGRPPSWQPRWREIKAVAEWHMTSHPEEAKQWIGQPGDLCKLVACVPSISGSRANALHTVLGLPHPGVHRRPLPAVFPASGRGLILGIWICYPPVYYIMLWSSLPVSHQLDLMLAGRPDYALSTVTARRISAREASGEPPRQTARGLLRRWHLQAILKPATAARQGLRRDHDLARCSSPPYQVEGA